MAMALHQPCLSTSSSSVENVSLFLRNHHQHHCSYRPTTTTSIAAAQFLCHRRTRTRGPVFVGKEETELQVSDSETQFEQQEEDPTPDDLEYVGQIQRVLKLLTKNRDMIFSEVKLTVMIEDPREVERRRLLGIEDSDAPTRDDLVAALEDVNEGRIPKNHVALRMLAEEMINWPNLEVEVSKKKPSKSLYAKVTDTGVDPKVAAKRLNFDWDSAAEIEDSDASDDADVPPAVGYGALYLVTAFPVIIGVSVVLILFYNSLQ
ncbi:ycf3-interacting protein 1, chloroplastic [Telopea speciosissima]|uniref:ycf3-interacting protein 1, chloroplastic n=1 Tax=Telopea speciosissima TaxID=54955 RepID=UPI001CC68014|nr:ycf3-interacting protein 1, chloroplastic [Telopea speciosissima]